MKDCNCCTHDGPHWLHMDWIVHMQCLEFHLSLVNKRPKDWWSYQLVFVGFQKLAEKQSRRLQEKLLNLRESGLESVDYTMLGHGCQEQYDQLAQQVSDATDEMVKAEQEIISEEQ